jgi:PAS domain S-box-containing protein
VEKKLVENSNISSEKYKELILNAPFAFAYHKIVLDDLGNPIDYIFLDLNEAFELMTTLKKSEIINRNITEVIPNIKKDKFDWIKFYGEIALTGKEKVFEQYSDQIKRWYKVKAYSTEKYYFSTLFIDITDRKNYEENLIISEEKFLKLFKLSPDIIILTNIENDVGKVIDVNNNFLKLSGYSLDECIDKTVTELGLWSNNEERNNFKNIINKYNCIKNMEFDFKSKRGKIYNCLISSEVIEINNQKHILSVIRNITDQKKIQDKLNNERLKLKTIIESLPAYVFLKDINGVYLACNQKVEELFGVKEKDIIGLTDFDFLDKEIANSFRKSDLKVIESRETISNTELISYPKNNREEYLLTVKTPIYDSNGNIIEILGVSRDITEIYKVQQELHDREEIYSSIVNQASESIALIDFETARFVEFNNSACNLLGYTKEEFKNITLEDIQAKEKLDGIRKKFEEVKNKGTISFETKHKTKKGNILDIFASSTYLKIKDKEYISGIWSDITDRNKIQKELLENEKKLKEAQSLAKLGNWEFDIKNNKLQWSDEVFNIFDVDKNKFNASYEGLLNKLHPDERTEFDNAYKKSLSDKTGYDIVHRLVMKDSSIKYIHSIISNYYNDHDEAIFSKGTVQDITDRVKIEEEIKLLNQNLEKKVKERTDQLETANKDLESFAYSVSHDLRAPLRHIDGFTKLLKNSIKISNVDSEKYFNKITESSNKMSKMIDDLLNFSRLGRKILEKIDVNLNILVNQVIEQYKIDIGNRNIEFIIGTLPIVKGDQGLLQIVFENLISNAIKFTSKKDLAIIEINQCQNTNKRCNIYIKDNGAGFDMSYVHKLFGVFQRLHPESEFSGTGIGLANVKQIIQKHNGTIHVESEVNKGTTFYLSL